MELNYKTEPWVHQKKIVNYVMNHKRDTYGLFLDMGTGKTKTTIDILRFKCALRQKRLKTLIICPLVVMENWKREILTHSHIEEKYIQVLDGCTKRTGKKLKNPSKKVRITQLENHNASIFILNTENVSNTTVWDYILRMGIEFLIIDESHRFKSYNGVRTKALHKLSDQPQCRYKFILTGSPILQSALDLWSQFYILDPDILGGNYFSFRSQYFYDANAGMPAHVHFPNFLPKDDAYFNKYGYKKEESLSSLNDIIYKHAARVMKQDVLDLPDRTYQTVEVPLAKDQRKMYEDMRDSLVSFLEDTELKVDKDGSIPDLDSLPEVMKADLAITKTLRLQQLICGIFTDIYGQVHKVETNRDRILRDLLQEITANKRNKVVIWTVFVPTYERIKEVCRELELDYVMLTGQQNAEEKNRSMDEFNNNPRIPVIIANQGAGGTGVNLTGGNYEIYYSRSFNLEHDLQANARVDRGGQKRNTTRIDLVTPDTIDARIVEALAKKRDHAEDILEVKEIDRDEIIKMV